MFSYDVLQFSVATPSWATGLFGYLYILRNTAFSWCCLSAELVSYRTNANKQDGIAGRAGFVGYRFVFLFFVFGQLIQLIGLKASYN